MREKTIICRSRPFDLCLIIFTFFYPHLTNRTRNSTEVNGTMDHIDLEKFKNEILAEVRKEIQKMKTEIIDGEY